MPKVSENYREDKKQFILSCTEEIVKEKPFYMIKMRDIIKKAGFSQGILYHYYTCLDDVFVDYINHNTMDFPLVQKINDVLKSKETETDKLIACIQTLGEYIEALLNSLGGRTCFEFMVFYAYDVEKQKVVFPKLIFKQNLEVAQKRMVDFTTETIEKGLFHPQVSMSTMLMFIQSFIDGVAQNVAQATNENGNDGVDVSAMFQMLAKAVIGMLGV